jgi:glyoxylase-like metal-dependent hydrolase (beta-lactamase superfamily II)
MTGLTRLAPDLWCVPTTASNAYLWRTPAGALVVVDPGLYGDEAIVLDAVTQVGGGPHDITAIVLTHFHSDHAGAAAALAAASGAPVCAGPRDAAVLRGETPAPAPDLTAAEQQLYAQIAAAHPENMRPPRCAVDRELEHGDAVDADDLLRVEAVAGHTWGSIALHLPRRAAVLTGDLAIGTPGGQTVPGPFNVDTGRARRSLRRLAALDPQIAGLGHGPPLLSDAGAILRRLTEPFEAEPPG